MKRIISLFLIISALSSSLWLLSACGGKITEPCILCADIDKNGKCDICGKDTEPEPCGTCADTDNDGKCDACGKDVTPPTCSVHIDKDGDGKCDACDSSAATAEYFDRDKAIAAMDRAVERVRANIDKLSYGFPSTCSTNFEYSTSSRFNWESGMMTGVYWLAYEYTGDEEFKEAAERHIEIYKEHALTGEWLIDTDTGFVYSPSCVAGYKITGDAMMRSAALNAADILMRQYDVENKFIIRSGQRIEGNTSGYRLIVDSMMSIPLLFWATEQTGDQKYANAAVNHYRTTIIYNIRNNGSSYHHYQFDPITGNPVMGKTLQGYSNESCWGRGQAWLLYGFPIAYSYTGNEEILTHFASVFEFYLDSLPSDCIPHWDLDFKEGSKEPRDTSAAIISTCGFLEMAKHLEDEDPIKELLLETAANQMNAIIDRYEIFGEADGLIAGVTHALPQGQGIEECAVYADYFYMEALMRYINPDWVRYW